MTRPRECSGSPESANPGRGLPAATPATCAGNAEQSRLTRRTRAKANAPVRNAAVAANSESLREHACRVVADWPPLTSEQLDRLAALLPVEIENAKAA